LCHTPGGSKARREAARAAKTPVSRVWLKRCSGLAGACPTYIPNLKVAVLGLGLFNKIQESEFIKLFNSIYKKPGYPHNMIETEI